MADTITIRELADWEIEELDNTKKFKNFGATKCNNCGFEGPFIRRLFHVGGMSDDSDHEIIIFHLKQNYNLEYCVFRNDGTREFAESAQCPKCKTNDIIFDISKELFVELIKNSEKYFKK